jgi:hypothetical protein
MFDGVGRRRDQTSGQLVSIGEHSLNGYERDCLFRNNGDATFTDVAYVNQADRVEDGRGISVLDYDHDGFVDVLLRNYRQPAQLLHNTGRAAVSRGRWIAIKLIGTRSNRDAVGARITVVSAGGQQMREVRAGSGYLSGSSLVQHFGLHQDASVQTIHVHWPSGAETTLRDIAADQRLILREGETVAVAGLDER